MKKKLKYSLIILSALILIIIVLNLSIEKSCWGTDDLVAMCDPNEDAYLVVSSKYSCGEDATSLLRKGWIRCDEKLSQLLYATQIIIKGNVTKIEIYENNYFKMYLGNDTVVAQSPKKSNINYPRDFISRAPNDIHIAYLQENYVSQQSPQQEETQIVEPEYQKLNLSEKPGKVWVSIMPSMCYLNPWDIEKRTEDIVYYGSREDFIIEEKEQIKSFYQKKEIEIEEIIYGELKPTCRARCCPRGYTIYMQINKKHLQELYAQGYDLVPDQDTRISDIFQQENTCYVDSDCTLSYKSGCNSKEWLRERTYYETQRSENKQIMGIPQPVYDAPIMPEHTYCVCENDRCVEKEYNTIQKIANFFK